MIYPKDSIGLEVQFTAEGVRAGFHEFIDKRSADLKAMVGKFCDELAAETNTEVIAEKIRGRVKMAWYDELNRFIHREAHGHVYDQIEKLRKRINAPAKRKRKGRS